MDADMGYGIWDMEDRNPTTNNVLFRRLGKIRPPDNTLYSVCRDCSISVMRKSGREGGVRHLSREQQQPFRKK